MIFQIAVLCDAATDHAGKLNILGAFDTIAGQKFPLVHPHCAIALRMRFGPMEEGKQDIRILMLDADGHEMFKPMALNMDVRIPQGGYFASRHAVVNLERLPFKAPGQYVFDVRVNGGSQVTIPLQVIRVKPGPRPA